MIIKAHNALSRKYTIL